jgi:hypothetical protein
LSGNGYNRDTQLELNVVQTGADMWQDRYLNESAWVIRFEERHARLYDVRAYQ